MKKAYEALLFQLVVTLKIGGYGALLVQLIVKSLIIVAEGSGLPESLGRWWSINLCQENQ